MRRRPSRFPMRPFTGELPPAIEHGDATCGWRVHPTNDGTAEVHAWHRHVRLRWEGPTEVALRLQARSFEEGSSLGVALVDPATGGTLAAYRQRVPPSVRAGR